MTRLGCAVAAAISTLPLVAAGGEIYGTISEQGRPVARDTPVSVTCQDTRVSPNSDERQTDEFGSYRLFVRSEGSCDLRVRNSEPARVLSYGSPQRYNFEIVTAGGQLTLRRR